MGNPMVVIKDVSFGYGKDDILTDVNLIVEKQEYVGIIGANGAGKSTLMRLILGQLTPGKGEVTVYADSIGYVPQVGFHAMSNFPANVEEIVMTGLHADIGMFHFPKKEHRKKVKETLELVGMQDYSKRMLSELSGGQQQRVLIARALIRNPQLLVLDEPLTGIDKEAGEMLYQLLARLNTEYGMTLIMVTHNMEQVARYTNRFYHVSNGNVHLDKSSVLCDEVLMDKMMKSKPKKYNTKTYQTRKVAVPEKEAPYDAAYKGKKDSGRLKTEDGRTGEATVAESKGRRTGEADAAGSANGKTGEATVAESKGGKTGEADAAGSANGKTGEESPMGSEVGKNTRTERGDS